MRTIKARVIRNIGSESKWLERNPVLGDGEIALVRFGGRIRQKIGNGSLRFSDLSYQDNDMKISAVDTSFPFVAGEGPAPAGVYMAKESGIYQPGNVDVDVSGKLVMLLWDGVGELEKVETEMPEQDISGLVNKKQITSLNIFNRKLAVLGVRVAGDGTTEDNPAYVSTDYIPIRPDYDLRHVRGANGAQTLMFFDINKSFIGNIPGSGDAYDRTVTPLSDSRYVRANVSTSVNTRNEDISQFGLFQYITNDASRINVIDGDKISASGAETSSIVLLENIKLKEPDLENIYSVGMVEDGNYIHSSGSIGEGSANPKEVQSLARIPVSRSKGTHISFLRRYDRPVFGWFVNGSGVPIIPITDMLGVKSGVIEVPSNAEWLYVNISNNLESRELDKNHFTVVYSDEVITSHIPQKSIDAINYKISHPLSGKKIIAIGDSIAEYERLGTGSNDRNHNSNFIIRACSEIGALMLENYSIGGSTISQRASEPTTRNPISIRYVDMRNDADVIIVAAGTNDCTHAWTTIGTFEDSTVNTFYGALHVLCRGLKLKYVGKKIVFITPIRRYHMPVGMITPDAPNANGELPVQYVDAILEVCSYYGIPVLDNYRKSPLNPFFEPYRTTYMSDGTHPNAEGHKILAEGLVNFLRSI